MPRFWGTPWWTQGLGNKCTHGKRNHLRLMKLHAEGKCSGTKHLAESAAYPRGFCAFVVAAFIENRGTCCPWPAPPLPGWQCLTAGSQRSPARSAE